MYVDVASLQSLRVDKISEETNNRFRQIGFDVIQHENCEVLH
jgi:hypothetical protein